MKRKGIQKEAIFEYSGGKFYASLDVPPRRRFIPTIKKPLAKVYLLNRQAYEIVFEGNRSLTSWKRLRAMETDIRNIFDVAKEQLFSGSPIVLLRKDKLEWQVPYAFKDILAAHKRARELGWDGKNAITLNRKALLYSYNPY